MTPRPKPRAAPRIGRTGWPSASNCFAQFAAVINQAFARWDLSHFHTFELTDGLLIAEEECIAQGCDDDPPVVLDTALRVADAVKPGHQFEYVFDVGDCWAHSCTVLRDDLDPLDMHLAAAERPASYWGCGTIPDQYGRLWARRRRRNPATGPARRTQRHRPSPLPDHRHQRARIHRHPGRRPQRERRERVLRRAADLQEGRHGLWVSCAFRDGSNDPQDPR